MNTEMMAIIICGCLLGTIITYVLLKQRKAKQSKNEVQQLKKHQEMKSSGSKSYPSRSKKKEVYVEQKVSQAAKVISLEERKKDRNTEMNKMNKKRLP